MKNEDDPRRISFSELKIWNECPYKHKLRYIDKKSGFKGNEYTAFGTAIHSVCEKNVLDGKVCQAEEFKNSFEEEIEKLRLAQVNLNEKLILELKQQAPALYTAAVPMLEELFGKYEVFSVEEKILEDIEEFDSNKLKFKGFIDLVLKTPDGKYHIIDWKTCSWGWDSRRKSDPMTTYQLVYYKNYFAKKHNIPMSNIEVHFILLKRTAAKDNVELVRVSSGNKRINNSLKVLEKAVINIERKNYIKNRLSCKNCEFYRTEHCQ